MIRGARGRDMSRSELLDIVLMVVPLSVIVGAVMVAHASGLYSKGTALGLVCGAVAVVVVFNLVVGARQTRRRRARFVAGRTPLPDDEFLKQMNAAGDYARFCVIVRNGFAWDGHVAAEMLRPEDPVRELEGICFDGFYLHEIVFDLERELPAHAADIRLLKCFGDWKTITLGGLIDAAARELGVGRVP